MTSENNRLHLHARDGISSVQVNFLMVENGRPFSQYPTLSLAILDEANLVLWNDQLHTCCLPDTPTRASIERSFAIWDQLTIVLPDEGGDGIQRQPHPVGHDVVI